MDAKIENMHWRDFQKIPMKERDYETCRFFVGQNGDALGQVPVNLRDKPMYKLAVETNGSAIRHISAKDLSGDIIKTALKNDPSAFMYVPQKPALNAVQKDFLAGIQGEYEELTREASEARKQLEKTSPEKLPELDADFEEKVASLVRAKMMDLGVVTFTEEEEDRILDKLIGAELGENLSEEDLASIREQALMYDGKNLAFVPEEDRGFKECLTAMKSNFQAMGSVPVELRDAVKERVHRQQDEEYYMKMITEVKMPLADIPESKRTEKMIDLCMEQDPNALGEIPEDMRTYERCMKQVALNGLNLRHVPNDMITEDLKNVALSQNGDAVSFADKNKLTAGNWETALKNSPQAVDFLPEEKRERVEKKVEQSEPMSSYFAKVEKRGDDLGKIPMKMRTKALSLAAVKNDPRAIKHVHDAHRHGEIAEIAVRHDGHLISEIPVQARTEKLCTMALERTPLAYKYMPDQYKNPKNTMRAVKSVGNLIRYTPPKLRTRDVKLAAVRQDGYALEHLSARERTPEIIEAAVSQNGNVLGILTNDKRTVEACALAVRQDENAWKYVPKNLAETVQMVVADMGQGRKTLAEDLDNIRSNPGNLAQIPTERRTTLLCDRAVSQDAGVFPYVPEGKQTLNMARAAIEKDPSLIGMVRESLLTPGLIDRAIELDGSVIGKIPENKLTEDHYMKALQQKPQYITMIPKEKRTEKLCLCAVQNDRSGRAIAYVPPSKKSFVVSQCDKNQLNILQEYKERVRLYMTEKRAQSGRIIEKLSEKIDKAKERLQVAETNSKKLLNAVFHKKECGEVLFAAKTVLRNCMKRLNYVRTKLSNEEAIERMSINKVKYNNTELTKQRDKIVIDNEKKNILKGVIQDFANALQKHDKQRSFSI